MTIQLVDMTGRWLADFTISESGEALDLSEYAAGLYVLVVHTPFKTQALKVIKK